MTELTGGSTAIPLGDASTRGGGAVLSYFQVKLKDVPEMDLIAARDNRGEVSERSSFGTSFLTLDHPRSHGQNVRFITKVLGSNFLGNSSGHSN